VSDSRRRTFVRPIVALLLAMAVVHPTLAEPLDTIRHTNPGVAASASAYGTASGGTAQVSEQTGTFTYAYPIAVPPGRSGVQPSVALSYSSAAPLAGDVAAGWTLGVPEIYREPGIVTTESQGQPSSWRTTLAAGALVPFPEPYGYGSYYRPWGDTSFSRYRRVTKDRWEVQSIDGTVHRFDRIVGSEAPNDRFVLTSTTDRFGNGIVYTWQRMLSPAGIPSDDLISIDYTTNAALGVGPFARITFERGAMQTCNAGRVPVGAKIDPLSAQSLYLRGARPLTKIRTEVRNGPGASYRTVREISLDYEGTACTNSGYSPLRILKKIHEAARSPDGTWTALPDVSFDYGPVDQKPTIQRKEDIGGGKFPFAAQRDALAWGDGTYSGSGGSKDWSDTYGMLIDLVPRIRSPSGVQIRASIQP
jgi:hypothetical protein